MFNIPNLFTAANMLCGVIAIILAGSGFLAEGIYFIFLGAILDFFDGFLARILKQQSELGKQLDSLADMITFGVAPGVILCNFLLISNQINEVPNLKYNFISEIHLNCSIGFWALAGLIIPFFSLFRLAKFNIDTRQSDSFIGLPTPANTIFLVSFPLLAHFYGGMNDWNGALINGITQPVPLISIILCSSLMLISELPLFALKFKTFKWQENKVRFIFLISCGLLILLLKLWSIPIIVLLYLIISVINNIVRKQS